MHPFSAVGGPIKRVGCVRRLVYYQRAVVHCSSGHRGERPVGCETTPYPDLSMHAKREFA